MKFNSDYSVLMMVLMSAVNCDLAFVKERRSDHPINKTDMLYPGYQIPAILQPGNVSQFYYLSHRDGPPLTILVTPCLGPISWTVTSFKTPEENPGDETPSLNQWRLDSLIRGSSPLFSHDGDEAQNFTIPSARAGLYMLEIKTPVDSNKKEKRPKTVLLYATSSALDHLPISYENSKGKKHRALRFQPRRNRKRLTVSWSKSQVDPHLSTYCLAVTSGNSFHPPTLCAAQNLLHSHSHPARGGSSRENIHDAEGLHCLNQTRITLHALVYETLYNFTLYVISMRNNVSTRVATDSFKYKKTPAYNLHTGRYLTATFRKNDGFINFRYRPEHNTSTEFHVLPCGAGVVRAKLRGPGISRQKKEEVMGHAWLKAPPLQPGKRYTLRISATPQELVKVSSVRVLAIKEGAIIYPQIPTTSPPREYRSLTKCHEVTVGVESAGTAKYCILARELRGTTQLSAIPTIPDQCGLHRRRRSEYTYDKCFNRTESRANRAQTFTVDQLQPGKAYLIQITAQLYGKSFSYPLIVIRTKRNCQL